MKFISEIKDAIKYTFRDWKAIVLLGIILCIASTFEEWTTDNLLIYIILTIMTFLLVFIEEGYRYKIIKETINGNNNPPIIKNFSEMIKEGFIETITLTIYGGILWGLIQLYNNIFPKIGVSPIYQIIFFIFTIMIYLTLFGFPIYKALNKDKFLSGFNIFGIMKLYFRIGFLETIFIFILGSISLNLIFTCVLNMKIFELGKFLEFIASFFINPIILLFLTRLLALSGRKAIPS